MAAAQLGPGIVRDLLAGLERARLDLTFLDQILASTGGPFIEAPPLAASADRTAPQVLTAARRRLDQVLTQLVEHLGEAGRTERASCDGSGCWVGTTESTRLVPQPTGDTITPAAEPALSYSIPHRGTLSPAVAGVGAVTRSGTWGAG